MWLGIRSACSSALKAPACASAFAPPPDKTSTTLLTPALVVAAFHHPFRPPFGRPIVAPFLVRSLGHDRLDFRRPAVLVERDVRDIARIRMPLVARQHVLGVYLEADLPRGAAREVHPRHRGHQVADMNRLAEAEFVDPDGRTLPLRRQH